MGFGPLGIWEIIVIVGVALLIFGPSQLPKIARGAGKAFKSVKDVKDEITGVVLDDEEPKRSKSRERPNDDAVGPLGETSDRTYDETAEETASEKSGVGTGSDAA